MSILKDIFVAVIIESECNWTKNFSSTNYVYKAN